MIGGEHENSGCWRVDSYIQYLSEDRKSLLERNSLPDKPGP